MANFADLWEAAPVDRFGGLNEDISSRLRAANDAWQAKTGRELPLTSGARSTEEQIQLFGKRKSNPNLVAKPGTSLHEKGMAADISPEVPAAFLDQFGLHRPFGSKDPVHVEINPKSSYVAKGPSVTVSGAPASTSFADIWTEVGDVAPSDGKPVEKTTIKQMGEMSKKLGKEFVKPLSEISAEDWKEKSLLAPVIEYTASSLGIPGFTEKDKKAAEEKLIKKGKSFVEGVSKFAQSPVETTKQALSAIAENPGGFAGEVVKSTIYDPEQFVAIPGGAKVLEKVSESGSKAKAVLGKKFEEAFPKMEEVKPTMAGVGAAKTENATILNQAIETATPELKAKLVNQDPELLNKKGLEAQLEADSLPVPVRLSKGQALGDEVLISKERNERGFKEENARRLNEQNKALQESANLMKEKVAPSVFSTDFVADAEAAIERVSTKAKQFETDIKTAYEDLDKQGAGKIEVDSKSFSTNARNALMEKDDLEFLPDVIKKRLDSYEKGKPMNFNQYENLRTQIARETRKAQRADDGNAVHALTLVRGELEKLPLLNETAEAKVFADKARGLAKQEFGLLDKTKDTYNPLYADVVNGVADTKDFIPKLVLRSKNQDFAKSMSFLADDPLAIENLRSGTLDWIIRDSTDTSGNFKAGKFSKHIENLDVNKKLVPLFGDQAELLRKIARTGQRVEARPAGSYVNESGTTVSLGGMAKDYGQGIIESLPYVGKPIKATKDIVEGFKKRKSASESFDIGAGISESPKKKTKLQDIGKE
jgi:hypothetical protein